MVEQKEKKEQKLIRARDFTQKEINEISKYIQSNIPFTVLEKVFPLTEDPLPKSNVFCIMYRIVLGSENYVGDEETKKKLKELCDSCKKEYEELYENLIEYGEKKFSQQNYYKKITSILYNYERSIKINNLIDVFLVFAEKQILQDIEKIMAIDTSTPEGVDLVKKIRGDKEE